MFVLHDHDTHTNVHEKGIMHLEKMAGKCGVESLVWHFLAATAFADIVWLGQSASVQPQSLADKVENASLAG